MIRSEDVLVAIGGVLLVLLVSLFPAWILMLILGSLSTAYASVPAIGFFHTLISLWGVGIVGAAWNGSLTTGRK